MPRFSAMSVIHELRFVNYLQLLIYGMERKNAGKVLPF